MKETKLPGAWRQLMADLAGKPPCFKIRLPRPPSINKAYEARGDFGQHKTYFHKQWINECKRRMWGVQREYFDCPVAVVYEFPRFNPVEDCANFEKALSDFLVREKILKDDSLIWFNVQTWGEKRETVINIFRL